MCLSISAVGCPAMIALTMQIGDQAVTRMPASLKILCRRFFSEASMPAIDHPDPNTRPFQRRVGTLQVHTGTLHDHHLRPKGRGPLCQGTQIALEDTEPSGSSMSLQALILAR